MQNHRTQFQTPGKLILLGEYAVLQGGPGLVAAVDRFARVEVSPASTGLMTVASPTLQISRQPVEFLAGGKLRFPTVDAQIRQQLSFFSATLETALQDLHLNLPPLDIVLNTDDFFLPKTREKLGFGSSAALTVALLRALHNQAGIETSDYALFQQSVRAHYRAQGKLGSGIDIAASAFGGVLRYEITPGDPWNAQIEPLDLPKNLLMLVVWSGNAASTRELVARVNALHDREPRVYSGLIDGMQEMAFTGIHAVVNDDLDTFMDMVNRYHDALAELGKNSAADIVTTAHARISAICRDHGAAYKPSGAGGGDIGIAFSPSATVLEGLAESLHADGFQALDIRLVYESHR